jgi:hypothetical protein
MSELRTHRGHRVEVLEGDAQGVIDRGKEIEDLGEQMIGAADILHEIGDGASEERGRSIERIRDEVGDAHAELRKAGERYKPTGTVMKTYGSKLADVQAAMRTIVTDAGDAKSTLDSKRHAAATAAETASNAPDADPTDPTAVERQRRLDEAATTSQGAVDSAEADLDAQFALFDRQWDTWDEAYETALRGITDATEGNVSDDWTDNLAGVVEVVLEVLAWIGVALAIAAIIIGGPFIAVIAAIVGVIALIGTLFLYAKGRKGLGDVAWAVVGVLPFGKLGKLFQSGKRLTAIKEFLGGPYLEIATPLRRITALRGLTNPAGLRAGGNLGGRAASGLASRLLRLPGRGAEEHPEPHHRRVQSRLLALDRAELRQPLRAPSAGHHAAPGRARRCHQRRREAGGAERGHRQLARVRREARPHGARPHQRGRFVERSEPGRLLARPARRVTPFRPR